METSLNTIIYVIFVTLFAVILLSIASFINLAFSEFTYETEVSSLRLSTLDDRKAIIEIEKLAEDNKYIETETLEFPEHKSRALEVNEIATVLNRYKNLIKFVYNGNTLKENATQQEIFEFLGVVDYKEFFDEKLIADNFYIKIVWVQEGTENVETEIKPLGEFVTINDIHHIEIFREKITK